MSDSFFKFEREGIDFPFYNSNPKLNKLDWILLLISVLVISFLYSITDPPLIYWIVYLLPMVTILIICRFKLSLIFKKLTKKDIALMVVLTIWSISTSIILYDLLSLCINLPPEESSLFVPFGLSTPYLLETLRLAIDLINEELFKFSIFILVLALVYKLSGNRKMGVVCAAFVTMVIFGAWHFTGDGGLMKLISDIIGRGLGSICEVYSYVKTKNVLISYFIHLFFDIYCDLPFF
ncbi:MAG: hypothetical protein MJ224_06160 [archaeon]|nr:hypothetical protein [archaeon]